MSVLCTLNLLYNILFQFSLVKKRENAHTEGIWSCAWGKYIPGAQPEATEENGTESTPNVDESGPEV